MARVKEAVGNKLDYLIFDEKDSGEDRTKEKYYVAPWRFFKRDHPEYKEPRIWLDIIAKALFGKSAEDLKSAEIDYCFVWVGVLAEPDPENGWFVEFSDDLSSKSL